MFWGSVKCRFTDTRESLGPSRLKLWGGRAGGGGGGGGEAGRRVLPSHLEQFTVIILTVLKP